MVWAATGPLFGYSDTWQLVINTGTTIITFLMVFLIQNTQNRDAKAIHLKLDELLKGSQGSAHQTRRSGGHVGRGTRRFAQGYYERLHKEAARTTTNRKKFERQEKGPR